MEGDRMGKITYRPKKYNKKSSELKENVNQSQNILDQTGDSVTENTMQEYYDENEAKEKRVRAEGINLGQFSNVKPIGDLECDYHIYLEDYVYTYLYQYALADLSAENSAVFLGQFYPETKEAVIRGIIPIPMDKLNSDNEWIDEAVLSEIEAERAAYFENEKIIGWMHMQPGYGTMLTMKELREHRKVFGDVPSLFMLVDAVNKIETLYVYEDEELKEQTGYYMYYERNEQMQKYMLEHPFTKKEAKIIEDTVVSQFREIGKLRKQQYMQRKNVNAAVIAASIILIGLTAVIVKMNDNKNIKSVAATNNNIASLKEKASLGTLENDEDNIKFIIAQQEPEDKGDLNELNETLKQQESVIGDQVKEDEIEVEHVEAEEPAEKAVKENVKIEGSAPESKMADKNEAEEKQDEKAAADSKQDIKDGQYEEYIVKEGDTLANISYNKYGSSKRSKEIAQLNELDNTNYIRVGQALKLPVD